MSNKDENTVPIEWPLECCFRCGVLFDQSVVDGPRDWPGTLFEATGNWGSTIYDGCSRGAKLIIRICDKCVIEQRHRIEETGNDLPADLRSDVKEFFDEKERAIELEFWNDEEAE